MKAETKRFFWGDAAIYAALILLIAGLFALPLLHRSETGCLAEIHVNGETVETIELSALGSETLRRSVGGCEIEFSANGVRFVSANCPDRVCVHTGLIRNSGEAIACVPNRVAVSLRQGGKRGADYDVVAY